MSLQLEWSAARELAVLTIDRPAAKNAVDRATMSALSSAIDELESESRLSAVLVTAAGDHFVSGGDLKDFAELPEPAQGREMSLRMQSLLSRLEALKAPSFAVINGNAYGGGCELALACDVRIMKRGARLEFRQTAMGLTTGWGGGLRLLRLVGRAQAILLTTTGLPIEAEEALRIGLVDRVAEDPRAEAEQLCERIRHRSQRAVVAMKKLLTLGATVPPGEATEFEADIFESTWGSPEHRGAVARFLARD